MITVFTTICIALHALCGSPATASNHENAPVTGTWKSQANGVTHLLLAQDGYLTFTKYDQKNKKFFYTMGGGYTSIGDTVMVRYEFNSVDKTLVGKTAPFAIARDNKVTVLDESPSLSLQLTDSSTTPLTGTWRINGRLNDGKVSELPLRPRRTLKILTGTHFQWMAINAQTGEFSGTGGGQYTFTDGKYTESIHFFSRDSSRIGMKLSFKGEIKEKLWHHSGKSSKGDPIHETWMHYVPGSGLSE